MPGSSLHLPVLPLRETVVYPDSMTPLHVSREGSIALVEHAVAQTEGRLVLVASRSEGVEEPSSADLYRIGTEAVIHRLIRVPDGTIRLLLQGTRRVRVRRYAQRTPFLIAAVEPLPDSTDDDGHETEALVRQLMQTFGEVVEHASYLPDELAMVVANVDDPAELAHLIAAAIRLKVAEKQAILETVELNQRLRTLLRYLSRELEVLELGSKIQSEVHVEMSRHQRDWFLREQLKQIQEELGENETPEVTELRDKLAALPLGDEARKQVDRELSRLGRTPEQSAEYGVIRSYLEWIASLPWGVATTDVIDLPAARRILDRDHYDLDGVKERILDYLAVSKLKADLRGPILCFVGPPGVGKTSLGQSVARALGRRFSRISVGGVRDESEIRGHRRTYIGAMPGTIVRSLRDAGSCNPVFMIDEIDKMGADWRGDPSSAMLEVLDPEQNHSFRDHYLDLPFDLSQVLFICTANRVDTIPAALRDRMEIIRLEGYSEEQKYAIARQHLLPRQLREHGLKRGQMKVTRDVLLALIRDYTREAGVRELDRQLAALARKAARRIVDQEAAQVQFDDVDELRDALGRRRFQQDARRRTAMPGVATGLAVTAIGGDILFVEATDMPGRGSLRVTGQIGQVMEESAMAAVSWVRATAAAENPLSARYFAEHDIHIHIPAGAIPKDGPSAGVAMAVAVLSQYHDVPVRDDVAMTGEITLVGDVLPVGGIKEKVLAAQRAGITNVILPADNEEDLEDIPPHLAATLTFHLVDHVSQALEVALSWPDPPPSGNGSVAGRRPVAATRSRS